ncbi:hypothetical protein ACIG3E_26550 [Streptomyces sp. NPDC053474]|uniref:hypothetical protein n=1 Tax=Streptomyces sp. NPDC053474 TaxID=3365704 RepID=UPI0037D42D42
MTTMVPVCPYCGRVECICPAAGGGPAPVLAVSVTTCVSVAETPGVVRVRRSTAAPPPS